MSEPLHDLVVAALGRHYQLEGEIGRGGMSVVYRARDLRLNRMVAVKVLPPELAYDVATRTRFTREAQTSAQLAQALHRLDESIDPRQIAELDARIADVASASDSPDGQRHHRIPRPAGHARPAPGHPAALGAGTGAVPAGAHVLLELAAVAAPLNRG